MNKDFVPYIEASALKELGFNESCFGTWNGETLDMSLQIPSDEYFTQAPLYQQAFRWFRETHGLFVAPNVISYAGGPYLWFFEINSIILPLGTDLGETDDFETYEQAELACLIKLIEIVKNK